MNQRAAEPLILLPGIILPAAPRYAALLQHLAGSVAPVLKDLEVYSTASPPPDYSIDLEVAGLTRTADAAGFERFHLYGHSGGGAVALAYTAAHPDRLLSLAVDEASDFSPAAHAHLQAEVAHIRSLPPEEQLRYFFVMQLAPGVEPPSPPSGPAPEWMALRPVGVEAFAAALQRHHVDPAAFGACTAPVYYSYGSLSHPTWQAMRDRLAAAFPNFRSELYEGLHHFNTSHAAEPARVAAALRQLWRTTGV